MRIKNIFWVGLNIFLVFEKNAYNFFNNKFSNVGMEWGVAFGM